MQRFWRENEVERILTLPSQTIQMNSMKTKLKHFAA